MKTQSKPTPTKNAGSAEPDIQQQPTSQKASVGPSDEHSPKTLAEAKNQLRAVAARYNQSGDKLFTILTRICFLISWIKERYAETPPKLRPVPTWAKYAPTVAQSCGLRFKSDRMADSYARLYADMQTAGISEVQKRVSEGSYREVRAATNRLLKKSVQKPAGPLSCMRLRQAAQLVRKAMDDAVEVGHLRSLATIQESLSKAAQADRLRTKDVIPEMAALRFPDVVRQRINYAVRAASGDPIAAGVYAFEQSLFDAVPMDGSVVFPNWSKPEDLILPLTPEGAAKWAKSWLAKRDALVAALVRRFESGSMRPRPTDPIDSLIGELNLPVSQRCG